MTEMSDFSAACSRCAALCCTLLPFSASREFPESKPAGTPCRHLTAEARCGIHPELRRRGWIGCTVFDCLGAGQRVTERTFNGRSWRDDPALMQPMVQAFAVMRVVQEIRYHAHILARHPLDPEVRQVLADLTTAADELADGPAEQLTSRVVSLLHQRAGRVFDLASRQLRPRTRHPRKGTDGRIGRRADLSGQCLRGWDLTGADLRGSLLLGTDLSGAALHLTDLLGADLRGARLAGADLSQALFLTQSQVSSAQGSRSTRLPLHLARPDHWAGRDCPAR